MPILIKKPDDEIDINLKHGENVLNACIENLPARFGADKFKPSLSIDAAIFDVDEMSPDELISVLDFDYSGEVITIELAPRGAESVVSSVGNRVMGLTGDLIGSLIPTPEIPNLQGEVKQSPNSNLKAAQNSFRKDQAISNKAGETYSTPDFIQPSYFEYSGNVKTITELLCIGAGRYNKQHILDTLSDGETLLSKISGSVYDAYVIDNGDTVPADIQKTVTNSNNIDGQALEAPNSELFEQEITGAQFTLSNQIQIPDTNSLIEDFNLQAGSQFTIDGTNAGLYEVSAISQGGGFFIIDIVTASFSLVTETVNFTKEPPAGETENNWLDWVELEIESPDDIWFHVVYPNGIQKENRSRHTVEIEIEIRDAALAVQSATFSASELTESPQFRTFKVSDTAIVIPSGMIEFRARKVTLDESGFRQAVQLEEVASVKNQSSNNYGDVTLVSVKKRATSLALGGRANKINCIARRELRTYNPSTGLVSTTYSFTQKAVDYIFYLLYFVAGYSLEQIDLDSLFSLDDNLSDPQLGQFDYSFDDKDIDIDEAVKTAANAIRSTYFKLDGKPSFIRNEALLTRSGLIDNRIMSGLPTERFSNYTSGDYDSIKLEYFDPTINEKAFIERRINKTTGSIESGIGDNVKEINFSICRNTLQATNRADFEIRLIAYIIKTVSCRVYKDALYFTKGMKIGYASPWDNEYKSGEILGQSQDLTIFDTSELVELNGVDTYYCYLTDNTGLPTSSPFVVTERTDTKYGFIAPSGPAAYLASGQVQLGSRYIIATLDNLNASDLLVDNISYSDSGYADVSLLQYDQKLYETD